MSSIMEKDRAYIVNTYSRQNIAFVSGKGAELFDENGKRYIDFGSGIAVNTFGAADEMWAEAVSGQARTLQHVSNYYYQSPQSALAELLCQRTGMEGVFFSNSGAEANECAIKAARKYANDRYGVNRPHIITLQNSFHGRTVTTLSATGQEEFHTHFMPFTPGFIHVPANDIDGMRRAVDENGCAAIMLELIQGEGGVHVLHKEYVRAVAALAEDQDILLLIDEVQTGNGRTGTLFAYMQYGITPDIVTTAKGLAGGLPLGATLFHRKARNVLSAGTHGSTFGGNPVCAAGALSILTRLDEALLADVRAKSNYIMEELHTAPGVRSLSGLGLMLGIETGRDAKEVLSGCREKGLLVLTAKEKVRLLPPLNISMPLLAEGLAILKEELKK